MIDSHALIFSDFKTFWYRKWAKLLKQDEKHLEGHALRANKFWQNAVMAQALYERGVLESGRNGLGFGVGRERLPALFASMGVNITATDQDFTTQKAKHWQQHELAEDTNSLNRLSIATAKDFQENVSFQPEDMTDISNSLDGKYDFLWSNCALGHLGSIPEGLKFIVESTRCLRPGGYAVHTTEVNVLSNNKTVDSGDTVIFRPRDFYRLSKMLAEVGCEMEPVVLDFGKSKDDLRVTMHPEFGNDYSKINFKESLITQVVLIIYKPEVGSKLSSAKKDHLVAYMNNLKSQKRFRSATPYLKNLGELRKSELRNGDIKVVDKVIGVSLSSRPKDVYLEFINNSGKELSSVHNKSDTFLPINLSTSSPTDRESVFFCNNWFNGQANRPSSGLFIKDSKGEWSMVSSIEPNNNFAFRVTLDPKNAKKGEYVEKFALVQEGSRHMPETELEIAVSVK